jgi:hypothetical protein
MGSPFFSILRLESDFPRPVGDSANPRTHAFPVKVAIVPSATVTSVIYGAGRDFAESFVQAANDQIGQGAIAVGTSCGFLFEHQQEIQNQLAVPFISSSLAVLSNGLIEPIAVLTFDDEVLSRAVWFQRACSGIQKIRVGGIPKNGHLYSVIRNNEPELNTNLAGAEVVQSALSLVQKSQQHFGEPPRTLLLECTNLGVYKDSIQKAFDEHRYVCELIDYNDVMARCWNAVRK